MQLFLASLSVFLIVNSQLTCAVSIGDSQYVRINEYNFDINNLKGIFQANTNFTALEVEYIDSLEYTVYWTQLLYFISNITAHSWSFQHCHLNGVNIESTISSISSSVACLDLSYNEQLTDIDTMKLLCGGLIELSKKQKESTSNIDLQDFNFNHNPIEKDSFRILARTLFQSFPSLSQLSLSGCHLTDDSLKIMSHYMKSSRARLTSVSLSQNPQLSSQGLASFLQLLQEGSGTNLVSLDLSYCVGLGDAGVEALALCIERRGLPRLKHLYLKEIHATDVSISHLLEALVEAPSLESFDVSGNVLFVSPFSKKKKVTSSASSLKAAMTIFHQVREHASNLGNSLSTNSSPSKKLKSKRSSGSRDDNDQTKLARKRASKTWKAFFSFLNKKKSLKYLGLSSVGVDEFIQDVGLKAIESISNESNRIASLSLVRNSDWGIDITSNLL